MPIFSPLNEHRALATSGPAVPCSPGVPIPERVSRACFAAVFSAHLARAGSPRADHRSYFASSSSFGLLSISHCRCVTSDDLERSLEPVRAIYVVNIAFCRDNAEGIKKDVIEKITNISPLRLHRSKKVQVHQSKNTYIQSQFGFGFGPYKVVGTWRRRAANGTSPWLQRRSGQQELDGQSLL